MEEDRNKNRKKKQNRYNKKTTSSVRKNVSRSKWVASIKSEPSKKQITTGVRKKRQDALHLEKTIGTWKQRWKNKAWRRKWKLLWGKNRWRASIKKRWKNDKKWRRKWMKKILKKWWDKKWRRKWQKRWIDRNWLEIWNKDRLRRRGLWKKRWTKSGAKKMGLTFNEFLVTERRLKALQKIDPATINRRRREKRLYKERRIRDQQEKREKMYEEWSKKSFRDKLFDWGFNWEYYGPETFEIRPAVIQFNFYILNGIQGLAAFILVLYSHLTNQYHIPHEFVLHGLYTLVYFANAMDFYGSIFGMVTSYHLETSYGRRTPVRRRKNKKFSCRRCKKINCRRFNCCQRKKDNPGMTVDDAESESLMKQENAVTESSDVTEKGNNQTKHKRHSKSKKRTSYSTHSSRSRSRSRHTKSKHERHFDSGNSQRQEKATREHLGYSSEHDFDKISTKRTSKPKVKCQCRGLAFMYCCFVRTCFRPGRSREFVNRMGYCSWILLELAWFFNIFFFAYYTWLESYYKNYEETNARCQIYPRPKYCDEFDSLYFFLCITVGVTFILRNIFVFIIGMCFSERYLKRCQSMDPNDEMASTCSDTDIDYSKVPRQILVPHLLSKGKYPYVLPGPSRPVDYMLQRIKKTAEKHQKEKLRSHHNRNTHGETNHQRTKHHKHRRRILSTYERETKKMVAEFKQIRRAQIPLEKGKRKPLRIPVAPGVPDIQQLPPDLMTAKAWAWLYDESDSSESDPVHNVIRRRRPVKWRRSRKRKVKPIDSAVLTVLHDPKSKSNIPIKEMISPKLENLSDRDSTDSLWSGRSASLFEYASGYSSDHEHDKRSSDHFMELMKHQEEVLAKRNIGSRLGDQIPK